MLAAQGNHRRPNLQIPQHVFTVPATFSHEWPTEKFSDPEKMLVAKSTCNERHPYGHPVLTSKRGHVYDGHVQPLEDAS